MASAVRSFLRGVASLFDFTGSLARPETDRILDRSDRDALASDWEAVGGSLRAALRADAAVIAAEERMALTWDRLRSHVADGTVTADDFREIGDAYSEHMTARRRRR